MNTFSIHIKFVWFGFSYRPHSLSVLVMYMGRKRKRNAFAILFGFDQLLKYFLPSYLGVEISESMDNLNYPSLTL